MFFSNGCPEQVFVYLVLTARNKVKVSLGGGRYRGRETLWYRDR